MDSTAPGEKPYRPHNLKRDHLQTLQPPVLWTTASLTGRFVHDSGGLQFAGSKEVSRVGKLILGWVSFSIFWLVCAALMWYVLSLVAVFLVLGLTLAIQTPGIREMLRWASARLQW
jgi:hypothetical protein